MAEQVLLVIGASSDCGLAVIKQIQHNYTCIYAHYGHTAEKLLELKETLGDKLVLIQDDFSGACGGETVLKVMEEKGVFPEHVIHFSAQPFRNIKFVKAEWDTFEKDLQISLRSAVIILQSVIKKLVKQKKRGKIVFMLSSVTENCPPKYLSSYVTVKYALMGLMKSLSVEYAQKGIMVNAVSPSMMETKFLREIPELVVQQTAANSPFGRNLRVEDVVPAFEFLLSDKADLITGQNIVVSGGNM